MIPIPTAHGNSDADRNETPRVVVVPSTATPVHETTRHDGTTVTPSSPENTVAGLLTALRFQMEYYFGETNWPHDRYLQSLLRPLPNSRSETWCVPLAALGRFPRVRHYHAQLVVASQSQTMATTPSSLLSRPNTYAQVVDQPANPAWIRRALQHSTVLSVSDNDEWIVLVRNRHGTDRVAVTTTAAAVTTTINAAAATNTTTAHVPTGHPLLTTRRAPRVVSDQIVPPRDCTEPVWPYRASSVPPNAAVVATTITTGPRVPEIVVRLGVRPDATQWPHRHPDATVKALAALFCETLRDDDTDQPSGTDRTPHVFPHASDGTWRIAFASPFQTQVAFRIFRENAKHHIPTVWGHPVEATLGEAGAGTGIGTDTGTAPDGHEPYTVDSIKPPYGSSASAVNHGTIPAAYPAPAWMPPNLATAMYHPASNLLYYTRHGMHPYAYPPQQGFVAVNYVLPPQRGYSIPASEYLYAAAGAMPTAPFHVDVVPPGAADVPSEPVQSGNTTTESFGDHPVVLREPDPWDYGEFADMAPPPPLSVTSTAATIAPEEDEGFALFPPENLTDPSFVPDGTPSRGIVGYHKDVEEHVYSPESKKPTHKVFRSKGPRQFCNQSGKKQSLPPQEPRTPSEVKRNTTKKGSRGNRKQCRDAKVPSPSPNEMKSIGDGSASGKEQKDPQRGGKGSKTRTRSKQLSKGKMNLLGEHFPALDGNVVSSFPVPTKTPLSASEGISTEGVRRKVAASDTRLEKFATR